MNKFYDDAERLRMPRWVTIIGITFAAICLAMMLWLVIFDAMDREQRARARFCIYGERSQKSIEDMGFAMLRYKGKSEVWVREGRNGYELNGLVVKRYDDKLCILESFHWH